MVMRLRLKSFEFGSLRPSRSCCWRSAATAPRTITRARYADAKATTRKRPNEQCSPVAQQTLQHDESSMLGHSMTKYSTAQICCWTKQTAETATRMMAAAPIFL
eukprot:Amastigsp_a841091_7993.p5 type:complete len:104 gc:universal Amastigsp_a841091_7993:769-458(-)